MRKWILVLLVLVFFVSTASALNDKASKFKTTFKITFNSITLEEAAKLEKQIKKVFKDACSLDTTVSGVNDGYLATTTISPDHINY